mgnify:CR=1 FL=1
MTRELNPNMKPDPQNPPKAGSKDNDHKGHQQQGGIKNEQNKHTDKGSGL